MPGGDAEELVEPLPEALGIRLPHLELDFEWLPGLCLLREALESVDGSDRRVGIRGAANNIAVTWIADGIHVRATRLSGNRILLRGLSGFVQVSPG
jgi:hypothetical protein